MLAEINLNNSILDGCLGASSFLWYRFILRFLIKFNFLFLLLLLLCLLLLSLCFISLLLRRTWLQFRQECADSLTESFLLSSRQFLCFLRFRLLLLVLQKLLVLVTLQFYKST